MGVVLASFMVPALAKPDMGASAIVMLYIMCAAIGYALATKPGQWISTGLKRIILKDKLP